MINIKRTLAAVAVAGVGGITAFTMTAGPALALPADYTVTAGDPTTNVVAATNVTDLAFEDTFLGPFGTAGNPSMTCTTLDASGTVNPGDHAFATGPTDDDDPAGQITPAAGDLIGCDNDLLGPVTITPSGTWKLSLESKSGNGGVGYLSGVQVHLEAATCEADATGTLKGTYDGTTGNLVLDPSFEGLTLSGIDPTNIDCQNVGIYNGDPATGAGTVNLDAAPSIS